MILICFSKPGSYDMIMLPPGNKFSQDFFFFINETLERYDEHRNERRNRTDHKARFAYW
jgi:hypothetical protein